MMEILFVSHKFPPSVGGMEKQSFELITGMRNHCKVHRIVYGGTGSRAHFFGGLRRRILEMCRVNPGISVIHFNDALLATFCLWHKGYTHLKRIVTLHGLDIVFPSEIYRKRILPKFNRYDHFIAVSHATADHAIALGIAADKVSVINNGVDQPRLEKHGLPGSRSALAKQYGIPFDSCVLVAVGRPVRRKGFSWFIRQVVPKLKGSFVVLLVGPFDEQPKSTERVLGLIPSRLREKVMLFLGFGSDAPALRLLFKEKGINKLVRHLGHLPENEKRFIMRSADAFIMPNVKVSGDMEGFGLVCLEASLAGTIVFAADIDGIPDAIRHEKNGFLLRSEDPETWAFELNRLIANPAIYDGQKEVFQDFTVVNFGWGRSSNTMTCFAGLPVKSATTSF